MVNRTKGFGSKVTLCPDVAITDMWLQMFGWISPFQFLFCWQLQFMEVDGSAAANRYILRKDFALKSAGKTGINPSGKNAFQFCIILPILSSVWDWKVEKDSIVRLWYACDSEALMSTAQALWGAWRNETAHLYHFFMLYDLFHSWELSLSYTNLLHGNAWQQSGAQFVLLGSFGLQRLLWGKGDLNLWPVNICSFVKV